MRAGRRVTAAGAIRPIRQRPRSWCGCWPVAVTRPAGSGLRALIVLLWRSGLRISEALALEERDLDAGSGSITVRRGKGGRRRIVGMDPWGWTQLKRWNALREELVPGPYFCVISGPTSGRPLAQVRCVTSCAG
jgi:integrase